MTQTYDPDLHVIVPREPTLDMRAAGVEMIDRPCNWFDIHHADDVYREMIEAAPQIALPQPPVSAEAALGALETLYAVQNDAPLERDRAEWEAAMAKARAVLQSAAGGAK